jgi:hypothetical protein
MSGRKSIWLHHFDMEHTKSSKKPHAADNSGCR